MKEICLDTETTGLDPATNRIIEIGCIVLDDLMPTGERFNVHINPQCPLDAKITQITGLTDHDLADKPVFADSSVCQAFVNFIGDVPLIAHNARFDREFLNAELERCGQEPLHDERFVDTLALARTRFPGVSNSLDALAIRFGLAKQNRSIHGAHHDCVLLAGVYLELRGGRARSFDFAPNHSIHATANNSSVREPKANARSRLTRAERVAHDAFVDSIGESALWKNRTSP